MGVNVGGGIKSYTVMCIQREKAMPNKSEGLDYRQPYFLHSSVCLYVFDELIE